MVRCLHSRLELWHLIRSHEHGGWLGHGHLRWYFLDKLGRGVGDTLRRTLYQVRHGRHHQQGHFISSDCAFTSLSSTGLTGLWRGSHAELLRN